MAFFWTEQLSARAGARYPDMQARVCAKSLWRSVAHPVVAFPSNANVIRNGSLLLRVLFVRPKYVYTFREFLESP